MGAAARGSRRTPILWSGLGVSMMSLLWACRSVVDTFPGATSPTAGPKIPPCRCVSYPASRRGKPDTTTCPRRRAFAPTTDHVARLQSSPTMRFGGWLPVLWRECADQPVLERLCPVKSSLLPCHSVDAPSTTYSPAPRRACLQASPPALPGSSPTDASLESLLI